MPSSIDSEYSDSDAELQEAFVRGELKPGLNKAQKIPNNLTNNVGGLRQKLAEFKLDLEWIERLDFVNKQAPLAPELAAQMFEQEQKRENQLKNNKKLPQLTPSEDPILNDFKMEMMFYRQAQATVLEAFPKISSLDIPTNRPEDYFAEMAKSDEHMHKVRENLMKKQVQQQRSEKVKQLRHQRKEGKAMQIQTKLQRQKEKKQMLDQVKKVRKGITNDVSFLDNKSGKGTNKNNRTKKLIEKRKWRDQKFGFGGKKRGSKLNTRESASDVSEYRKPIKPNKKGSMKKQRPGKARRKNLKNKRRNK